MLHRRDSEGLIAISQPAHSWLSGQIARQWGNGRFDALSEDVCLASELHDIGFLEWEESPTLDAETGLPHEFLKMPPHLHLELWRLGVLRVLRFGRLPALLVSLHFTNICRQNWVSRKKDGLARDFIEEQEAFQRAALTSLRNDSCYGAAITDETARRDQQMVSALDWLSLVACLTIGKEQVIPGVPSKVGRMDLKVIPLDAEGKRLRLEPWPLPVPSLRLVYEGRRLLKRYESEPEMRAALKAAERITLVTELASEGG
jgi:hypothetical protein